MTGGLQKTYVCTVHTVQYFDTPYICTDNVGSMYQEGGTILYHTPEGSLSPEYVSNSKIYKIQILNAKTKYCKGLYFVVVFIHS